MHLPPCSEGVPWIANANNQLLLARSLPTASSSSSAVECTSPYGMSSSKAATLVHAVKWTGATAAGGVGSNRNRRAKVD